MDAEQTQALADMVTVAEQQLEATREVNTGLAAIQEMLAGGQDHAAIVQAIESLRASLKPAAPPAPPAPYDLVLSDVQYDKQDRIVHARFSRVAAKKVLP